MWQIAGFEGEIATSKWPSYDETKTVDNEVEIVLQINGKIRDKLTIPAGLDKDATQEAAMKSEKVIAAIDGKQVVKVIVVPGKLVNIVVK